MRKLLILMLLFSINTSLTMAQSSKYIIKKSATTSKTTKSGTTQKKKPSYIQKRSEVSNPVASVTKTKDPFKEKFEEFFDYDFIHSEVDTRRETYCLQQIKGYEWVINSQHEEKQQIFPVKVTYINYPSRPNDRVVGGNLYDNKGNLKAVLQLRVPVDEEADRGIRYYRHVESIDLDLRDSLIRDLSVKAYKENAYDVNTATEECKKAIEKELGILDNRFAAPAYNNDANNYCYQLKKDAKEKVRKIIAIERVDSVSFKVQYATYNREPTCSIIVRFRSTEPYKTEFASYESPWKASTIVRSNEELQSEHDKGNFVFVPVIQ